jgi:glycosyltransferase involved in cell wall biosynthesis
MSISVIITCFNEGRFLHAAIDSVIDQTRADLIDDIIVCDDGSDMETQAILQELPARDPRIWILPVSPDKPPGTRAVSLNRNRGVSVTLSPMIAFLDADDLWQRDKIERQVEMFNARPKTSLVYTGFSLFWSDGRRPPEVAPLVDLTHHADQSLAYFLDDPPIVPSTVLMRRTLWDELGGFDEELEVFEDTEFFFRCTRYGSAAAVNEPLVDKRLHESAMTSKRNVLMEHHARVAFNIAAQDPRLLPYVTKRLSERARKLGNLEAFDGRRKSAFNLLASAISLNPLNFRAWLTIILHYVGGAPALKSVKLTLSRASRS